MTHCVSRGMLTKAMKEKMRMCIPFKKTNFKQTHILAGPPDDFFDADDAFERVFIQL